MYVLLVTWSLLMANGHYNIQQEVTPNLTERQCEAIGKESVAELRSVAQATGTTVGAWYKCTLAK